MLRKLFRKKPAELTYRFIIENGEVIGLVATPKKWQYDRHWIVSPEGKETSYHFYDRRDATESDYDLHLSFESIPIYKVKYRRFQCWIADTIDDFFLSGGLTLLALFSLSLVVSTIALLFESIHDKIIHSIYYQIGFWGLFFCAISLSIVLAIANYVEKRIHDMLYVKQYGKQ